MEPRSKRWHHEVSAGPKGAMASGVPRHPVSDDPDVLLRPPILGVGEMNRVLEFGHLLGKGDFGVGQIDLEVHDEQRDFIGYPTALCRAHIPPAAEKCRRVADLRT